ncbi:MAG: dUTP diphosphatase [Fusobacteriaceae bacterium]
MKKLDVEIILAEGVELPKYETELSAGVDVRANIVEPIVLKPGQRVLVPTGIKLAAPAGYEVQVRPRSGLAYKNGITVLNTPGCVDADYRGDIGVILINLSQEDFVIQPKERIAQIMLNEIPQMNFKIVSTLSSTERGEGGFGSTGTN